MWAGNLAEAESWYEHGLKLEGKSYLSALAEASLFAAWAESGYPRANQAWMNREWSLPISAQLNSLGAWTALERSVIGLARMGLSDEISILRPLTEQLLLTNAQTYMLLSPFRTIAGIAAACDGDWAASEDHHIRAIRQTESAPYRHLIPVAHEWYAHMLLKRCSNDDIPKAREELRFAIAHYDALGFSARGRHAIAALEAL